MAGQSTLKPATVGHTLTSSTLPAGLSGLDLESAVVAGKGRVSIETEASTEPTDDEAELISTFRAASLEVSTAEAIRVALARGIEDGIVEPGARLGEGYLASLFSVSRTPVREALSRLEAQRFAERDGRGLIVPRVSVEQIIEVFAVREALDGTAARLAATHALALDLNELDRINVHLRNLATAGEYETMADMNVQFHDVLGRASRNQMLLQFVREVLSVVRRFKMTTFAKPGRALEAVEEHEALLAAIRSRDPEASERIAREHMRNALEVRIQLETQARTGGGLV
jgi:DNA-binding GntR family transcriptional regulator